MIYSIKHFWAGDDEPTEYFVSTDRRPTIAKVVKVLGLVYEPDLGDMIMISSLEVHDLDVVQV